MTFVEKNYYHLNHSSNINTLFYVIEIGALQVPWNSMELLVSSELAHSKFHGFPWNCSCRRNWHTASSMDFHGTSRVSEIGALQVPWNSIELLMSPRLAHLKFHGIPWNCLCHRNWRTSSSMEFHGTARVSEIGALEVPWNCSCQRNCRILSSMEFHGTARVNKIGGLLVPWNCSCQRNWRT